MAMLNRLSRLLLVVLLVATGASSQARAAEPIDLSEDGWHTWSVASVDEFEHEVFYVLIKSGETKKIHIVGNWCDGRRQSEKRYADAVDLGFLETNQSIDWFQQYIGDRSDLSSDALAAISMHEGPRAVQILIDIVESDAHMDVREEAVFWMAQSESQAAFAYLDRLLMLN